MMFSRSISVSFAWVALVSSSLIALVTAQSSIVVPSSGIAYSMPTSTANSTNSSGAAAFPTPNTQLAPENITGSRPDSFQPPVLIQDNGTYGPPVEIVHYYYENWSIGLAVVPGKQILACYTRGTYNYTLGLVTNLTAEEPYPSQEAQVPVSQLVDEAITNSTGYQFANKTSRLLISVQALYQSPDGAVYALDTGRPTITTSSGDSVMAYAQVGGPKLIRLASNGSFERTYTFPGDVHYPDSSINDVRFDLRKNITQSGGGVAYIVDSSNEGRNGFIVLDLATGESWRRLTYHPSLLHVYQSRASYLGQPFYQRTRGQAQDFLLEGFDGLALSPDGEWAYYAPLNSQYLYRVPTSVLLDRDDTDGAADQRASNAVQNLGQKGSQTNGFDADSNGVIYLAAPEQNAIFAYSNGTFKTFVRDPRLFWIDSIVIADDGYLYGNVNQLPDQDMWNDGQDLRSKPGFMFRAKLPNGGTRITSGLGG